MTKFLNSDLAAFLLLVSTLDLFTLTTVFLGRMDVHSASFEVAVVWVVFGGTSAVAVFFLCFCMGGTAGKCTPVPDLETNYCS